jgi:hypothetical protein
MQWGKNPCVTFGHFEPRREEMTVQAKYVDKTVVVNGLKLHYL